MQNGSKKILLFNPRSARSKHRVPNSILQVAASIYGKWEFVLVDGNLEKNPLETIKKHLSTGGFGYFGLTVMPGPQLRQAVPMSLKIKELWPEIKIIWGGYFASNQHRVVLENEAIDFVVYGPGDRCFPRLLEHLEKNLPLDLIENLIWKTADGTIVKNQKEHLLDQDALPALPYDALEKFYPFEKYLPPTFLGRRTLAYHSSMGCPFRCSFCAIVPIFDARWKGQSAQKIAENVLYVKEKWGADSIEFHDNNFFTSQKRVREFAELMLGQNLKWWGEGRIDTLDAYDDETLFLMKKAGCEMIFFGAETGNDEILKQMDKGGKQTAAQIRSFAERMARVGIIPEYSFVLGLPAETPEKVMAQIDADIAFIQTIKKANPATEIIIYVFSPVPTEGSELFEKITAAGFRFPEKLEDWLSPAWENFDLRKNPLTPWLTAEMVQKIKDFEVVLNAQFPTVSDAKLTHFQRVAMKMASSWRYRSGFFRWPYELRFLQKFWLRYRQPEIEGM